MTTLYIDPIGGLAGDMLCAALFDAGLDFADWKLELQKIGIPLPELSLNATKRGVFRALYFHVHNPKASTESHSHAHSHHHEPHSHSHSHTDSESSDLKPVAWEDAHRTWKNIQTLINQSALDSMTKSNALKVFHTLAKAEAKMHGTTIEDVHFHEVGAIDSIVDIIGFCLGCSLLGITEILCGRIPISGGLTWSEHGQIPLPAPATLELIHGLKTRKGVENHEQVTPTGAAILSALATQTDFPAMTILKSGYGAGTRNPSEYANITRISIGIQDISVQSDSTPSEIIEVQSNIDDMTGEALSYLQSKLFASGALDVSFQSIFMKKNRPAWLLRILCPTDLLEDIAHCVFQHSSTFGIRYSTQKRLILRREFHKVETEFGSARIKTGTWKNIQKASVEYDDAQRIAEASGLSLVESQQLILQQWKQL